MERLSSFTIFDGRNEFVRLASGRIRIRLGQFQGWFRDKTLQLSSLPGNEDLIRAVLSEQKSPVEGSRYRVGECINVYLPNGECRRFKVFGVRCGGFSNVYTVIDLDEMKPYCLKENRALPGDEQKKNEKLAVEAEISLKLGVSPHLVTTYSAFYYRSRLFILTEYLPVTSLDLQLGAAPLPAESALRYAVHLCRAISYARSVLPGFVHGDIKPGNCFITSEGILKLGDFGLASAVGLGKHSLFGEESFSVGPRGINSGWGGTSAYMSPEMLDKDAPDRSLADVYAFGVTLFEMLCGTRPFSDTSKSRLAEMHRHSEPPLHLLNQNRVPQPIVELVGRCLAKSPTQRPESFAVIENELQQILHDQFQTRIPTVSSPELSETDIARRALSFAALTKVEEAGACVDDAILNRERSPELLACKAISLAHGGRIDDAYAASTSALMMRADLFIVLLAHARVLIARGDLERAEDYLLRSLQLRPDNCVALNLLGELYTRLAQYDEAAVYFDKSLTLDSSQAEPWESLAKINLRFGRSSIAIKLAKKALCLDPRRADSNRILGDAYLSQDQLVEAVRSYKAALVLAPFSRETAHRFVRSCCKLYRTATKKADLKFLRILIQASKVLAGPGDRKLRSNHFANNFIGLFQKTDYDPLLLFFIDRPLAAIADDLDLDVSRKLKKGLLIVSERSALQAIPTHVVDAFGRILYYMGEYSDCQAVFERKLERYGPNETSYYYLAACSEIRNDLHSALKYYKKASRFDDCENTRTGIQRVTARIKQSENTSASPVF